MARPARSVSSMTMLRPRHTLTRVSLTLAALAALGTVGAASAKSARDGALTHQVERYEDGRVRRDAEMRNGQLDGTVRGWYENGRLAFEYSYRRGLSEGVQQQWLPSGVLLSRFNHVAGHEVGQQQMWNADGTIRSNYVIRDGKRYGLIGAMGCTGKRAGELAQAQ